MYFGFGNGDKKYTPICSKTYYRCIAYRKDKTLDGKSLERCHLNPNKSRIRNRVNIEDLFKDNLSSPSEDITDTRI